MNRTSPPRSAQGVRSSAESTDPITDELHQYVEADLAMKERVLARLHEPDTKLRRYRAPASLIDFLRTR